ncbi:hypothetical protein CN238_25575 [Sinorhizobium meliloti]|nr:hypothetical protein CN238_25575 [Sinorhizobium meliloti]RVH24675.1 hypothetical protein CN214_25240 [Sinorhizobium meliloti]
MVLGKRRENRIMYDPEGEQLRLRDSEPLRHSSRYLDLSDRMIVDRTTGSSLALFGSVLGSRG